MTNRFIQILAALLMCFGCVSIAAADRYNWRDLANAGSMVLGTGAGIITGHKFAELGAKDPE